MCSVCLRDGVGHWEQGLGGLTHWLCVCASGFGQRVTCAHLTSGDLGPIPIHPGVTQKGCPSPTTVAREAEGASLPRESQLPEPHSLYGVLLFSASPDCIRLPAPLPSATASSFSSFLPPPPSPSSSFSFLPLLPVLLLPFSFPPHPPFPLPSSPPSPHLPPPPFPPPPPPFPPPPSSLPSSLTLFHPLRSLGASDKVPSVAWEVQVAGPLPLLHVPPPPNPQGAASTFLRRQYMEKSWASPKAREWGHRAVLSSHHHTGVTQPHHCQGPSQGRAKA